MVRFVLTRPWDEYQFGGAFNNLTHAGVRIVCLCVFVSAAALVSTTSPLKVKVRYQQKALYAGNKMNVRTELKIHLSRTRLSENRKEGLGDRLEWKCMVQSE